MKYKADYIVIQPACWYEGETLCCGWAYLSGTMPEGQAHNFARHFPEAKLWKASDPLPEPIRKPNLRPCPFCGSTSIMPTNRNGLWWVECDKCLCSSRQFTPEKMTDAEVFRLLAEDWNKREPDPADIDRLRQIEKWAKRETSLEN